MHKKIAIAILAMIICGVCHSETYYVNVNTGKEGAAGTSESAAFKTIQSACDKVEAGDTVIVAPGVYFENIQLNKLGKKDAPITFKADKIAKGRVVITGAVPEIRKKEVKWELVDKQLQLYSIPLGYKPSRVLYDNVDLMPFPNLASLKEFRFNGGYPGTLHGFAFDQDKLYVRLHGGNLYGSQNPNDHIMAVSPAGGGGHAGLNITKPTDYVWGIMGEGSAYVVIDGFTFETPGVCGVWVKSDDVTIRNGWFFGCRSGLQGRGMSRDPEKMNSRVIVEYCDFSQFPAFDDMKEVMDFYMNDPWRGDKREFCQRVYWWQRKGDHNQPGGGIGYNTTYETGIVTWIGHDWVIRYNYIHDAWEGLSASATSWSHNLKVYGNRMERLIDNAIEAENHAENFSFYQNEVVDVFEPISWQPLDGTPWPGAFYVYQNLIMTTPQNSGIWSKAGWHPGIFKLGAEEKQWKRAELKLDPNEPVKASGDGMLAFNNTIYCLGHSALTRVQSPKRAYVNFHIFNNIFALDDVSQSDGVTKSGLHFSSNVGIFAGLQDLDMGRDFTAEGGKLVDKLEDLKWKNPQAGDWSLLPGSPALGVMMKDSPSQAFKNAGAIPTGNWTPLKVGPQEAR